MGSIPSELSLDFRASYVPKSIHEFLNEVSTIENVPERASKLGDFVRRLEEEMKKIDAFKRELPLCMILLSDAILTLKKESSQCAVTTNPQPVLEEFIPMKKDCEEEDEEREEHKKNKNEKDSRDKKNWMSSVQLWNTDDISSGDHLNMNSKQNSKTQTKMNDEKILKNEDPFPSCRNRSSERSFAPFIKPYSGFLVRKEEKDEFSIPGLSLLTPGLKNPKEESGCGNARSNSGRAVSSSPANVHSNLRIGSQQTARKQRRCWSPELHRRFVNALQQLGGSQVATPKQIRELMQVDGLTNDEVKSHLQKYRLHTRRVPSGTSAPANQSVVVLGGLWLGQDQYGDSSKASSSQSGSPQGPLQLAATRGGSPTTGDEDSMQDDDDDDDDAKSEGFSWKNHLHKPLKDDVHRV
ncbi:transcription factor HHO6-like [Cannabis sativa]|uniref:transcription factor HHO6-like n=1 Tax=Cannabis sativa TaxID=3483 RepID=UPI0029CA7515|nr:transcription factor HHO6-like [Cannabis sativa]